MKNYFRDKKYLKWLFKAPKENTEHFEGMVAFVERYKIELEEAILFQFPKIKRSEISYTVEGLQIDTVSGISQKEVIEFVDSFRNGKKEGSK